MRKVWQYEVLSRLRAEMGAAGEAAAIIDQMFSQYQQGFYVYAKPRVKNGQGISRYIGRYIRHPAIADTRIISCCGTVRSNCSAPVDGSGATHLGWKCIAP